MDHTDNRNDGFVFGQALVIYRSGRTSRKTTRKWLGGGRG
jgi:hypothetical protein